MGRRARFSDDAILDAARGLVSEAGTAAATVVAVADRLGAPSGSIYHRFASRDLLVARLWLRTVQSFQQGFLAALSAPDVEKAARDAMRHTHSFAHDQPADAKLLLLHRREDLVAHWPDELGSELEQLNRPVRDALLDYVRRRYAANRPELLAGVRFALVDLPYAAARAHVTRGSTPSATDEELLLVAGTAVLHHLEKAATARSGRSGPEPGSSGSRAQHGRSVDSGARVDVIHLGGPDLG